MFIFSRFIVNGFFATFIHLLTLEIIIHNLNVLYSVANFFASILGILSSYLGCRYFVFDSKVYLKNQFFKFLVLYISILIINTLIMFLLSDIFGINYRISFMCTLLIQVFTSFFVNKFFIFL